MDRNTRIKELVSEGYTQSEIALEFGLTQSTVSRINRDKTKGGTRWSKEEEEYLIDKYGQVKMQTIAKNLGRSVGAIKYKRNLLGLGKSTEAAGFYTLVDLAKAFDRTTMVIKRWVEELGLDARKIVLSESKQVYQINPKDFWEWAENNKDNIDFSRLEAGTLGKEPLWVAAARKEDYKRQDRKSKKLWTKEEDEVLKTWWYSKTQEQLGKILGRSTKAIEKRGRVLKLKPKTIQIRWKKEELEMALDMINKGLTYKEVAYELGREESQVSWKMHYIKNAEKYRKSGA